MSRFANLADKPRDGTRGTRIEESAAVCEPLGTAADATKQIPPSRIGRKAIAAYFAPEMSLAMHVCARKHGLSLQELMAEAFNDVLRKYGQSPVGH